MPDRPSTPLEAAATQWLARRDRGLSAKEQDAYLDWLRQDPAHGATIVRLENAWNRLDALIDWQPGHSVRPNPDLLAPKLQHPRWLWPSVAGLAAATLVAVGLLWETPSSPSQEHRAALIQPGPERLALGDGSLVELNSGAKLDVRFTSETRFVALLAGEAHFTVAKDAQRPFVVAVDDYSVRAVGTAFAVERTSQGVSVLVTEGRVQLDESGNEAGPLASRQLAVLCAGQEAIVRKGAQSLASSVEVRDLVPSEVQRELAWQSLRLEFADLPLRDVVEEFNRYNSRKLVIEDTATGDIVVGGSFRADNVESFIRLLDLGFGVTAEVRGHETVLVKRR